MRVTFLGNFGVDYSSENHHRRSLEALGHEVVPLQETQAGSDLVLAEAMKSDMFVWVHTHGWETPGKLPMRDVLKTLKSNNIPSVTYHLDLWLGLQRQHDLDKDDVYKYIEYFFTVDAKMADWFNANTRVKGIYLPAGVFGEECYMAEPSANSHDVIFVGSRGYHPEYKYRPQLIDWLHKTYGKNFSHYGGDGLGVVRGEKLNQLYADTKVAVGDSLNIGFKYPYYWSDRIYETTGRGGFVIHPYIEGLETQFEDGKEVIFYEYGDFDKLQKLIDYYVTHDEEREAIRKAGHERTKKDHTYTTRWQSIIDTVVGGGK